jgi:hypothetical protein
MRIHICEDYHIVVGGGRGDSQCHLQFYFRSTYLTTGLIHVTSDTIVPVIQHEEQLVLYSEGLGLFRILLQKIHLLRCDCADMGGPIVPAIFASWFPLHSICFIRLCSYLHLSNIGRWAEGCGSSNSRPVLLLNTQVHQTRKHLWQTNPLFSARMEPLTIWSSE